MITRFKYYHTSMLSTDGHYLIPDGEGEWCQSEDVTKLEKESDRLLKAIAQFIAAVAVSGPE